MIGDPDVVLQIPEPVSVRATGRMPYQYARVTTDFAEDRWVRGWKFNRRIGRSCTMCWSSCTNAAAVVSRSTNSRVSSPAYVPGNSHQQYPEGFAKKLPAGATLIFQLHYTPNGTVTSDQTRLGLVFSDTPPEHILCNVGIANRRIEIPPGASSHAEQATLKVPPMCVRWPSCRICICVAKPFALTWSARTASGSGCWMYRVTTSTGNWSTGWPDPLDVAQGSRIEVTGWVDNSAGNPANPDPHRDGPLGPPNRGRNAARLRRVLPAVTPKEDPHERCSF